MIKTCKVPIEQYEFKKVKKLDAEIQIPLEPVFYQEWNYRVHTGLFPEFRTWSDGSLTSISIIRIKDKSITRSSFSVSPSNLSDIISRSDLKGKSDEDSLIDDVVRHLLLFSDEGVVNKKCFLAAYTDAIQRFNTLIKPLNS